MTEPGPCGTTVDRYQVLERIGHGGFGTVYRARHVHTLREVALKLLDPDVTKDPTALQRFEREAQVVSSIKSPHVVEVYDYGVLPQGQAFLVMELLEGTDLSTVIDPKARLSVSRALALGDQVLDGLAAVHRAGAIHRDLKPSNIFLARVVERDGEREVVKLLDFGCARARDRGDDRVTRTGTTIGTPLYMSPEQLRGGVVDVRSDVYSAAVVVYELLSGQRPHEGTTYDDLVVRVCTEEPRSLSSLADVPAHVATPVMRGLDRDPTRRWPTADAFARALRGEGTADTALSIDVPVSNAALEQPPTVRAIPTPAASPVAAALTQPHHPPRSALRRFAPLAAMLVIGVAGSVIAQRMLADPPAAPAPVDALVAQIADAAPPPPIDAAVADAEIVAQIADARPAPRRRITPHRPQPDPQLVVKQLEATQLKERVRQIDEANRTDQQRVFDVMRRQTTAKTAEERLAIGREVSALQIEMSRRNRDREKIKTELANLEAQIAKGSK